jgi:hypothetical protein
MAIVRGRGPMFHAQVIGLEELESQFARIGNFPRKYLTKAAKAGMTGPLADARNTAPVGKTGILKRSIRFKRETPNKRNKAVYRIGYSAKFTDNFRKPTTGVYGGKTPYAYYPHSVEYGYKTKKGHVAGKFFMEKAVARNEHSSIQKVTKSLSDSIDDLTK